MSTDRTPSPSTVIFTLRQLQREQVRMSYMDRDALAYIVANGLVIQTEWPAHVLRISEAGAEFIAEHST